MTPADLYDLSRRAATARDLGDGVLAHMCWARIVAEVEELAHTERPGGVASAPGLDHGRNPQ